MTNEINKILSDWDPIGVGYPLSLEEYESYAAPIKLLLATPIELRKYLINSLIKMGLTFDENNSIDKKDLDNIIESLLKLKN